MDIDIVNNYLQDMKNLREGIIQDFREDHYLTDVVSRLQTEVDLLSLLQKEIIVKRTFEVRM